jgi:predicted transglutaminase-like cysteine proteinase
MILLSGSKKFSRVKFALIGSTLLLMAITFSLCIAGNIFKEYFAQMNKNYFDQISVRFEPSGASLLARTRKQLLDHMSHSQINEGTTLTFVNDLLNRVPQIEDSVHWGQEDYWATPAEFIASNGGDCEDFVIAKYFALRESGIPAEKLRLTYVKSFQSGKIENHMVLAYYSSPTAEPLLLDNLLPQMLPASKRPELLPVYEFNGELSGKYNGSAIRKWDSLVEHMNKEFEW